MSPQDPQPSSDANGVSSPSDDGPAPAGDTSPSGEQARPQDPGSGASEEGGSGSSDQQPPGSSDQQPPGTLAPAHLGQHHPPRPPRRTGIFVDPEDLRVHVGNLLRAILGGYEVDAFGNYTFTHDGARAFVTVGPSPVGPQVGVFSVTNLDVDLTPPLASFLLETNHTLGFGAFSYDTPNRAVWLRHTLHGSSLDLPELQSAVAAVATTAAALDETIRDRFGGRTFQEAPDDVQRGMEPPDTSQSHPPGPSNAGGYL